MSATAIAKAAIRGQPAPEELLQGEVKKERSGQGQASAIYGNGLTSSRLYVSASAIVYARTLALLALLLAAGVLYLRRKIYHEVVEALFLGSAAANLGGRMQYRLGKYPKN